MNDPVFTAFLGRQQEQAASLAAASDLVDVFPVGPVPCQRYILKFSCRGLIRGKNGVEEANRFDLGIYFPADYLRRAQPGEVITWFGPLEAFHPNIRPPFLCPGHLKPGTSLVDIIYQCFEIITYQKVTMHEKNALNWEACGWARKNTARFPIDKRGLKRNAIRFRVRDAASTGSEDAPGGGQEISTEGAGASTGVKNTTAGSDSTRPGGEAR
jgi:hypothetical protein